MIARVTVMAREDGRSERTALASTVKVSPEELFTNELAFAFSAGEPGHRERVTVTVQFEEEHHRQGH